MNNRDFEKEYVEYRTGETPNVWEKIEKGIKASESEKVTAVPRKKQNVKKIIAVLAAAAAVLLVSFAFRADIFRSVLDVLAGRNNVVTDSEAQTGDKTDPDVNVTTTLPFDESETTTAYDEGHHIGTVDKEVL